MMEKIDWYREVLELEPNSKVFFPLARLLVENNESAEAITVLEQGLERHPDYTEARLFLIELMHKDGLRDACSSQIAKLSKMFSKYSGFWQAWAACLSAEPGEEGAASVIRFLAAHFLAGPISLSEALSLGAGEIIKKHQKECAEPRADAAENASRAEDDKGAAAGEASQKTREENEAVILDISSESAPGGSAETPAARQESAALEEGFIETQPPFRAGAAVDLGSLPDSGPAGPAGAFEASEEIDEGPAPLDESEEPLMDGLPPLLLEKPAALLPEEDEPEAGAGIQDEASASGMSIRTRSMAEVLAEQGDYKGALEIYAELAASERDSRELKSIKNRIRALKKLASARPAQPEDHPAPEKNERIKSFLESIVRRVEARMNN